MPRRHGTPKPGQRIGLNSAARRALIAHIRATQPDCHLCGYPINLDLDKQRHPLGSVVDELVPRSMGGSATDPANCRHSHRCCNNSRHTKPITPEVRARCRELVGQIASGHGAPTLRVW